MFRRRMIWSICLFLTTCGQETQEILRSQTPADAAILEVTPGPTYQFDAQTALNSTSHLFTVTNRGKKAATEISSDFYLSITFTYQGGYPGADGTCGVQLEPGASCTVRVTFTPQYVGDFEQILRVGYNNGYTQSLTDFPILRGRGF